MNRPLVASPKGIATRPHGESRGCRINIDAYALTARHGGVPRKLEHPGRIFRGTADRDTVEQTSCPRYRDTGHHPYNRYYDQHFEQRKGWSLIPV